MAKKTTKKEETLKEVKPIKIDVGCGPNKIAEDWIGIDQYKMKGVDIVMNIGADRFPFDDDTVDEVHCSHTLEHLTNWEDKYERVHLFNELYRIMKKGAKATFIIPHWNSMRYYGDPTHREPFSEFALWYLNKKDREAQLLHTDIKYNKNGYNCDFSHTYGYNLRQDLLTRNYEYQMYALQTQKEAAQDLIFTLIKN